MKPNNICLNFEALNARQIRRDRRRERIRIAAVAGLFGFALVTLCVLDPLGAVVEAKWEADHNGTAQQ